MTSPSLPPPSPSPSTPTPPSPSPCFYGVLPTPYGGRGAFAKARIPKNTTILQCDGPYASVVLRKFRKEVCAWCFAWCFESAEGRKSSWSVRLDIVDGEVGPGGQKGKGGGGATWTPWFCREGCRGDWVREYFWRGEETGSESLVALMNTLEKTLVAYRTAKSRSKSQPASTSVPPPHPFTFLDTWTSADVSESNIDSAWKMAEILASNLKKPSKILEVLEEWNAASAEDPRELLTEFEADCARFVLDGIVRQALQTQVAVAVTASPQTALGSTSAIDPHSGSTAATLPNAKPTGLWQDLLHLQNNELQHIRSKPYMLGVFIRVYLFLQYIVRTAKPVQRELREGQVFSLNGDTAFLKHPAFLETLGMFLGATDSVRAILARDHGNVFGIWEKGLPHSEDGGREGEREGSGDDGEMFGWGMYVFGSYFNHGESLLCGILFRYLHPMP